jgi:hypothetical protein
VIEAFARLAARGSLGHPAYQRHGGRLVQGLWGMGFAGRPAEPEDCARVLDAAWERRAR